MSGETIELQIQDYLDDRMSAEDRRAFELRLARDDVLANRLREYLQLGSALRDEAPQLTPAFYTRLRARFDERQQRRPRWFRLLSWESAGLAAAAMLVVIVFVPYMLERGPESTLAPAQGDTERRRVAPADQPSKGMESKDRSERGQQLREPTSKSEVFADELEPGEPLAESEKAAVPSDAVRRQRETAAAPRPAASAPATKKKQDAQRRDESPERLDSNEGFAAAELDDDRARAGTRSAGLASSSGGRALPDGLVGVAEWVEVVDRTEWNRLAGRLPELIGPYDPSRRLILVGGDGTPMDCGRAQVSGSIDAWEIRFFAPAPEATTSAACLFVLPRDSKPVRVTGRGPDR